MDQTDFVHALEREDLAEIARIPKADLHNHAPRGGNIEDIERWAGVQIPRLNHRFQTLSEMQDWYKANIRCLCDGVSGYEIRIASAFRQAKRDGVTRLQLSFGLGEEAQYGSLDAFINAMNAIHIAEAPAIEFIPELSLDRGSDTDAILPVCEEFFQSGFYKSVDICGNEAAQLIIRFKAIYKAAKTTEICLRAHVGEFGAAASVREAVEELELNEVQHGIAAADDADVMRFLADNRIRLNVCPASNILLSRAKDYQTHPIRSLYDAGIPVTINTDDMLIFNVSLSEMYMELYRCGAFSADELDRIRLNGLQ